MCRVFPVFVNKDIMVLSMKFQKVIYISYLFKNIFE